MSEIDRFISDGNILLFVDQLRWETNPAHQEALKRLLIAEVDRFSAREERLQLVERILKDRAELIARQARLIAEMINNGADTGSAERRLRTFQTIQFLFEKFRADFMRRRSVHDGDGRPPPVGADPSDPSLDASSAIAPLGDRAGGPADRPALSKLGRSRQLFDWPSLRVRIADVNVSSQ